jgi:hypothetical protein
LAPHVLPLVKRLDTAEEIGAFWVAILAEASSQRVQRRAPDFEIPHVITFSVAEYARPPNSGTRTVWVRSE